MSLLSDVLSFLFGCSHSDSDSHCLLVDVIVSSGFATSLVPVEGCVAMSELRVLEFGSSLSFPGFGASSTYGESVVCLFCQ